MPSGGAGRLLGNGLNLGVIASLRQRIGDDVGILRILTKDFRSTIVCPTPLPDQAARSDLCRQSLRMPTTHEQRDRRPDPLHNFRIVAMQHHRLPVVYRLHQLTRDLPWQ